MRNNSITEELKGKGGQCGQESPSVTSSKHHCLRVSTAITTSKTYNLSTSLPSLSSSWMISFEPEESIIHLLVLNLIWSEKKKIYISRGKLHRRSYNFLAKEHVASNTQYTSAISMSNP